MKKPRIALVVTEILGLVHNGGIATATTYLSFVLAGQGHDVTIVYCGNNEILEPSWARRYREHGIEIERLDRDLTVSPPMLSDSYRLYHQLKDSEFSAVVFQDWQGLGHFSMVAKRCGLAFDSTLLVHICHGPTPWLAEANRDLAYGRDSVLMERLERGSAELSDVVVSPSRHLLDWMIGAGWSLPTDRYVIPYFTELQATDLDALDDLPSRGGDLLDEIVFFGRLEERKGVVTLCRALNLIGPSELTGIALTFLGRAATFTPKQVLDLLDDDVVSALSDIHFVDNLDQPEARDYLRGHGRVAVIPSHLDNSPCVVYECIEDRVPFLASRAGGTGELVNENDAASVLFDPDYRELAALLGHYVERRQRPAAAYPAYAARESWATWQRVLSISPPMQGRPTDSPLVTVVIPHRDRPVLLEQCVRSVMSQDYPSIEVVVVDDGSTQPASRRGLEELEAQSHPFPLQVIRQTNRYLGAARNAGARAAAGELITFLDDDDLIDHDFVSTMVRSILTTGADAVTCALRSFEEADQRSPSTGEETVWPFIGDLVSMAPIENFLSGAPLMTRLATFELLGGYHERYGVGHEDWTLATALLMTGRTIIGIPEHPYRYRIHPTSMIRTGSTFVNMGPVFDELASSLPEQLKNWPRLLRGLYEERLRAEQADHALRTERDILRLEVELRDRRIYLLEHGLAAPT